MKKDFILMALLFVMGFILGSNVFTKGSNDNQNFPIEENEYAIMVDGTDSTMVYHLYDRQHTLIGTTTADGLDSLINYDNQ